MVYHELGRTDMISVTKVHIIKYWLSLLNTNNCILKSCYDELYQLHLQKPNVNNWVTLLCNEICSTGFNFIWQNQSVVDAKVFMQVYKRRIHDNIVQSIKSVIEHSSKCLLYRNIVDTFDIEYYLCKPIPVNHRIVLCKFRTQKSFFECCYWTSSRPG